jgi:hypothetical protein
MSDLASNLPVPQVRDSSGRGLTDQQRKFVRGLADGLGAPAAARNAGYTSPDTEAYRLLRTPSVQAALEAQKGSILSDLGMLALTKLRTMVRDMPAVPTPATAAVLRMALDRAYGPVAAPEKAAGADGKPMTAADIAALRADLARDVERLSGVLGAAAGDAAKVVEGTVDRS